MTPEPRRPPTVPSYGDAAFADLPSSLLASLDPIAPESQNVLGLPSTRPYCLLVVDGLGWELLRDHPPARRSCPSCPQLPPHHSRVPVHHGHQPRLDGHRAAAWPARDARLSGHHPRREPAAQRAALGFVGSTRRQWQPLPTVYERAAAAGIAAVHVTQGAFRGTGLTVATMRGADFRPADSMGALAAQAATALREYDRAFVTVYHGDLDGTGHVFGVGSDAWYNQLAHVDKLAEQLAGALPSGTCMCVTADHGMVDIGARGQVRRGRAPRACGPGWPCSAASRGPGICTRAAAPPADLLAAWREMLGDRAWVMSRDEAIKEGWFGPVDAAMTSRIGDVVAAPAGSLAIVATKAEPRESALTGMHGSLTPSEQLVPALMYTAA